MQNDSPAPQQGDSLAGPPGPLRALDPLLFSSLLAAGVAGLLALAASFAMELRPSPAVVALAASGTLVVYNVDRLRDLERDRRSSPLRSAFVERNRARLAWLAGAAALLSLLLAFGMPQRVWLLCGAGLAVGLLHRRLKGVWAVEAAYVTAVWIGVVVGLPALAAGGGAGTSPVSNVGWVAAALGGALGANLVASNLDEPRGGAGPRGGARRGLALALGVSAAGIALLGPAPVRPLAWVGLAEALSVWAWRPGERYGLAVLDGALLAGATVAVLMQA